MIGGISACLLLFLNTTRSEGLPGDLLKPGPLVSQDSWSNPGTQEEGSRKRQPDQLTSEITRWQETSIRPTATALMAGAGQKGYGAEGMSPESAWLLGVPHC